MAILQSEFSKESNPLIGNVLLRGPSALLELIGQTLTSPFKKVSDKPFQGDISYHEFPDVPNGPFKLYFEGNTLFEPYNYKSLVGIELRQKVISDAARKIRKPTWFTYCVDDEGTYLPFASTTDRYPTNLVTPLVLNAEFGSYSSHDYRWSVTARIPTRDGTGLIEVTRGIRYARGYVLDANAVWEELFVPILM